jgi:lipopolysaccharide export system protein LptA
MRANAVRVNIVDGKANKIFAKGHVVVDAPSGTATGDNGVYDVNPRLVTLTGHVVLTREKNVMRGSLLTVNLITGVATLDGGKQQGGRVQGLFTPESQKTEKP